MKVLVYGAGTLGSLCAARLKQGGHAVSLLARGERLESLRHSGLRLEHALTGEKWSAPIDVVQRLGPDDAYDLIIVVMGAHQVPAVLPSLQANLATPYVLFLGNNAAGAGAYREALGAERVLLGFYVAGGAVKEGVVWYADDVKGKRRPVMLGDPSGKAQRGLALAEDLFTSSGIPAQISPDIQAWLTTHAAVVVPLAAAVVQAGGSLPALAKDSSALHGVARAWKEGLRVMKAAEITVLPSELKIYGWLPETLLAALMRRSLANPAAAISFAHAEGARPEMRLLASKLLDLANQAGTPAPEFERIVKVL